MQANLTAILLIGIVLALAAAAGMGWLYFRRSKQLEQVRSRAEAERRRLDEVLLLTRELADAQDEKELVEAALAAVDRLTGGLGASFMPFDEWGQPMPSFTVGRLPEPVLRGWAEHMASEPVRAACLACRGLTAPAGYACPLQPGPFTAPPDIHCLPLTLGDRRLGMVNLYLNPGQRISPDLMEFLKALLGEMALAIESLRLRNQELLTLRQIHALRSPRADLSDSLRNLLNSVIDPLGVEALVVRLNAMVDERLAGLQVVAGILEPVMENGLPPLVQAMEREEWPGPRYTTEVRGSRAALPLLLPEGQSLGVLLAFSPFPVAAIQRQEAVLQTVAAQAALIVENERMMLSLEYTLVMQERTRLAREIHDGLAQVLAFLKLQTHQMQAAVNQGDPARLKRLIQENRASLEEAYQEIRRTIDNLRLVPDEGLGAWLQQAARDLEKSSGAQIELALQAPDVKFLPEIQAQMLRIVQESFSNIRKHARARQVRVALREWGGDTLLEICDDGVGFEPDDVPRVAQYGLRGMRERAELIGADFQIISRPGTGTTVRLTLPVSREEVEG